MRPERTVCPRQRAPRRPAASWRRAVATLVALSQALPWHRRRATPGGIREMDEAQQRAGGAAGREPTRCLHPERGRALLGALGRTRGLCANSRTARDADRARHQPDLHRVARRLPFPYDGGHGANQGGAPDESPGCGPEAPPPPAPKPRYPPKPVVVAPPLRRLPRRLSRSRAGKEEQYALVRIGTAAAIPSSRSCDARRRHGLLHQPEPGRPHRRNCAAADQPRVRAEPGPVRDGLEDIFPECDW